MFAELILVVHHANNELRPSSRLVYWHPLSVSNARLSLNIYWFSVDFVNMAIDSAIIDRQGLNVCHLLKWSFDSDG